MCSYCYTALSAPTDDDDGSLDSELQSKLAIRKTSVGQIGE